MKKSCIFNNRAFTLIELIVVIAVISTLSAIAIPKFAGIVEKQGLVQTKLRFAFSTTQQLFIKSAKISTIRMSSMV